MKIVELKCPNCGTVLKLNSEEKEAKCEFCGASFIIDDEVNHIQYDNAEQAGYDFEKGRQRAQAEQQYTMPQQSYMIPKKKKRIWLWALGWILCFPIPLTILIAKSQKLDKKKKIIIICVMWTILLFIGMAGQLSSDKTDVNDNSASITNLDNSEVTTTQTTEETEIDIITRKNHPTYYGSLEKSHEVWDDVEDGKVHFGDKNYEPNDKPIITISSYRNSDLIRGIIINFDNFQNEQSISLDNALKIAASYMPFEIMDKYYSYSDSRLIVPNENKVGNSYYVISYCLTEEGGNAYYSKEHDYSGTIDVIIQAKGESVSSIDITFGIPKWMNFLSKNGYSEKEWKCDLYNYR